MNNQQFVFGKFVEKRRKEMDLSRKDLAKLCGYSNLTKGIRRIKTIEEGQWLKPLVLKVIDVLTITETEVKKCQEAEAVYIQNYIAGLPPFKPVLIHRILPGFYRRISPGNNINEEKMLQNAIALAKKLNAKMCLQCDYNRRYWIVPNGTYIVGKEMFGGPKAKPDIGLLL